MTKGGFYGAALVVVIGLSLLNTVLSLVGKHENRKRASETHALAVGNRKLTLSNCHAIGGLAAVERSFIERQEAQTVNLLKAGITFGIPADQLPGLIAASEHSQALFLKQLDAVAEQTCAATPVKAPTAQVHGLATPKVHGSSAPAPSGRPQASNRTFPSPPTASTGPRIKRIERTRTVTGPTTPGATIATPGPTVTTPGPTVTVPEPMPAPTPPPTLPPPPRCIEVSVGPVTVCPPTR